MNTSGWSTRRRIIAGAVVIVLTAAALVVWGSVTDRVFGATVTMSDSQDPAPKAVSASAWPRKMTRKFRAGKLGTSDNRLVRGKISHKLNHYEDDHPKLEKWWYNDGKYQLTDTECILNGIVITFPLGLASIPIVYCTAVGDKPSVKKLNQNITKSWVKCGGQTLIGTAGGALFGVVTGGPVKAVVGGVLLGGVEGMRCAYGEMADSLMGN